MGCGAAVSAWPSVRRRALRRAGVGDDRPALDLQAALAQATRAAQLRAGARDSLQPRARHLPPHLEQATRESLAAYFKTKPWARRAHPSIVAQGDGSPEAEQARLSYVSY